MSHNCFAYKRVGYVNPKLWLFYSAVSVRIPFYTSGVGLVNELKGKSNNGCLMKVIEELSKTAKELNWDSRG